IAQWQTLVHTSEGRQRIKADMQRLKLKPMPIIHQMELQWGLIVAGIKQVESTS
ncbi:MAG: hypothetical protein HQK83_18575, partial [Fibrobacteria bacterium]|nr:hypothetical protein [Fibrobacteria bacterium]